MGRSWVKSESKSKKHIITITVRPILRFVFLWRSFEKLSAILVQMLLLFAVKDIPTRINSLRLIQII